MMIITMRMRLTISDTIQTEPNEPNEQYEEYVKQVEVKQSDDISGEVEDEKNVDVISRLINYCVKIFVCLNDEPSEDDKVGDNEVEDCVWFWDTQKRGKPQTTKILWSALSYVKWGTLDY